MKSQDQPSNKQLDNIETTNQLDDIDIIEYDELVRVTANAHYDETTGIDAIEGINRLGGIDDMDSINQLANMDKVASRKGMSGLQDTADMRNTDENDNFDHLDSKADIGYSEEEEDDLPYRLQCPHCRYEFTVAHIIVHDEVNVTCPHCSKIFASAAHVIGQD